MDISPANANFDLIAEDARMTTMPIGRPLLFEAYQKALKCFWTVGEVDLSKDVADFASLTSREQHFIKHVLAFFAASDKIVNVNLLARFISDVPLPEASYFYNFQTTMEDIHAHMYSLQLNTIVPDAAERKHLFAAMTTIPVIAAMTKYMFDTIDSEASLAERLIRMACVEGIFFTGCFCAIYWFRQRGLMPGLGAANEFIARDEGLHTVFAMLVYNQLRESVKLDTARVHELIREAVLIAKAFVCDALPVSLPEMNSTLMGEYIECTADELVKLINVNVVYGTAQPFAFMNMINMKNKGNFFETRVTEYSKVDTDTPMDDEW